MKKIGISFMILMLLLVISACVNPATVIPEYRLLPSKDTIDIGEVWVDGGIYVKYGVKVLEATATHSINNQQEGMYEVTYTATNNSRTYIFKRYVQVLDQTPPVISLNPGIDTLKIGETWIDSSVQVTDNSGTYTLVTQGVVNTAQTGTYIITYIATDSRGNETKAYRYVSIIA
jgi:hypothetical protein